MTSKRTLKSLAVRPSTAELSNCAIILTANPLEHIMSIYDNRSFSFSTDRPIYYLLILLLEQVLHV